MSERLLKCYGYCNSKHPKSNLRKFKANPKASGEGKNYCHDCYDKKVKEVKDREDLYRYIQTTYDLNFPTGNMLAQIKRFKEERGYTYKNIRFTLDYVFNIKRVYSPQTKFGIGFVPHFYDEMIDYYKDLSERRANTEIKKVETINVTITPFKPNTEYKEKKFIDMNKLLKEGK